MQKRKIDYLSLAPAVLSALLAIGVSSIFSACGQKEDGTWMHCHDAQIAVLVCALVITVVLAVAAYIKQYKAKIALYVVGGLVALVTFFIPGQIISLCMLETMRCYTIMQPFVRIMSLVIFVFCIVLLIRAWRSSANNKEDLKHIQG